MFANIQKRPLPNILITGTPGTGKTTMCQQILQELTADGTQSWQHINVSQLAIAQGFIDESEYDMERQVPVIDEDKLLDYLEDQLQIDTRGGFIVEYHSSEWFPERWFDLVVVLRTEYDVLVKRLDARGYNDAKVRENAEAEVLQVCLDEALASYKEDIIQQLPSNTVDDMDTNVDKVVQYVKEYVTRRQHL